MISNWQSGQVVIPVRSNEYGINVWNGGVTGTQGVPGSEGTTAAAIFGISRTADTVTTYWNGSLYWSSGAFLNDPLTGLVLMS